MSLARNALLRASRSQWLATQMTRRAFARRAVRKFMPGEELSEALGAAGTLAQSRIGSIVTRLGETLTGGGNAGEVRDHYLSVFSEVAKRGLPTWVSVKPTQLGLDASIGACVEELRVLAAAAESSGNMLWIDMEDSSYVDRTLDLFETLRASHTRVGLALQAYLYRTPDDLKRLLPLKPAIRLVKGAYAESPRVAFPRKRDTDAQYVSLAETLLASSASGGAFTVLGTHDMAIVHRMVARAKSLGVTSSGFEVHMLYGIRSAEQRALAADGQGVKCLISYGQNWFPWYMRRLAERPANVWFVLRTALS